MRGQGFIEGCKLSVVFITFMHWEPVVIFDEKVKRWFLRHA